MYGNFLCEHACVYMYANVYFFFLLHLGSHYVAAIFRLSSELFLVLLSHYLRGVLLTGQWFSPFHSTYSIPVWFLPACGLPLYITLTMTISLLGDVISIWKICLSVVSVHDFELVFASPLYSSPFSIVAALPWIYSGRQIDGGCAVVINKHQEQKREKNRVLWDTLSKSYWGLI